MNIIEEYKKKLLSVEEAVSKIKSNDVVVVGMAAAQPQGFLSNLHIAREKVTNVTVVSCLLLKDYEFFKYISKDESPFYIESWYLGNFERDLYKKGLATFIPNNLHAAAIDKLAERKINVYVGTATPMDKNGYFSLSLSLVYEKDMVEKADLVILEINENLPQTYGDTVVHISEVDYLFENNTPLIEVPPIEATETEKMIGGYIGDLIQDGATIQLGIGGIPNAISRFLTTKKDLGIHSEMLTDGMVDLVEQGVINNSQKTLWKGKTIGAFVMGTKKLYDFVDRNLSVEIHRGRIVNDPFTVAKNNKMISINTSLQIDLTGQVCSESFGYNQYTGTGGQLDMHRGATMANDGKGIIALRSTVKNDTISTIVSVLPLGSYVTVPRQEVDYIVTEFGVAHLRGKSMKARTIEMIKVAHPNFRDYLTSEAKKMNLI
ncbi:MAG: acetyl-CoA hydrolase/transferase family protein [Caldisericaceae bacterium]